ncbi:hypothetical protein PIB30_044951 [Stylosanthes scabra]|uniref:Uncharacterized protein n=1 Tax=Stylosanthes scabra TaxID=79078 RepID=A0ABU6RG05_9FABA|nr:hypothetical protein [Stylosanthes scabra]
MGFGNKSEEQEAKFGAEVAKESARNEKIAKKSLKVKSRAYAYAPKEPMRERPESNTRYFQTWLHFCDTFKLNLDRRPNKASIHALHKFTPAARVLQHQGFAAALLDVDVPSTIHCSTSANSSQLFIVVASLSLISSDFSLPSCLLSPPPLLFIYLCRSSSLLSAP